MSRICHNQTHMAQLSQVGPFTNHFIITPTCVFNKLFFTQVHSNLFWGLNFLHTEYSWHLWIETAEQEWNLSSQTDLGINNQPPTMCLYLTVNTANNEPTDSLSCLKLQGVWEKNLVWWKERGGGYYSVYRWLNQIIKNLISLKQN